MSAPSPQTPRRPLHERSKSQNNTLAIRVVPYSPPRPNDDPGPASPSPSSLSRRRGTGSRQFSTSSANVDRHRNSSVTAQRKGTAEAEAAAAAAGGGVLPCGSPGYALSPSPSVESLATVKGSLLGRGVSGSIASEESNSPGPARQSTSATTPAIITPSYPSNVFNVNAPSQPTQAAEAAEDSSQNDDDLCAQSGTGSSESQHRDRPLSRRRNIIALHADKTFSLVPQRPGGGAKSPRLSFSTTSVSSDPFTDDAPSSPETTLPERSRSISPCTLTPSPAPTRTRLGDEFDLYSQLPSTTSPWNYHMVGGLRKVPRTPDLKQSRKPKTVPSEYQYQSEPQIQLQFESRSQPRPQPRSERASDSRLFAEAPSSVAEGARTTTALATKTSFQSSQSASTTSETTNYKVYGGSSSPCLPDNLSLAPSSDESNYHLIGPSSSPSPSVDHHPAPPASSGSEENYVIHGDGDSSLPPSVVKVKRHLDPQYSSESLLVPPLRPQRKLSAEGLGYYTARSRESLRRVGSLTSITSILSQEATASLLASPAALYLQGGPLGFSGRHQDPWAVQPSSSTPSKPPGPSRRQQHQMIAHPHQWSSQLSTVASESECEGDAATGSRAASAASPASYSGRRSSGFPSNHSRHMFSISSSGTGQDDVSHSRSHSHSASDSLDRPQPSYARSGHRDASHGHQIRDPDEHGDGLADLEALRQKPSWGRLSTFLSNMSSDRNLPSSASSRANSLSSSSLPTWARLYYGSGEKKLLKPSSDSMFSDYNDSSRPSSSFRSGSPRTEHFPPNIYSQRRRPRQGEGHGPQSSSGSMAIGNMPSMAVPGWALGTRIRKQTSSIWSPHLRHDQRASRYSIWEPPSVNWSAESGLMGRRNVQIVLFVVGFVFPFAWMVAAILPLPPNPRLDKGVSATHFTTTGPVDFRRSLHSRIRAADVSQYEGAHWWRRLNRYMSVVGLLVIAAVVTLTVIGLGQGWGSRA